MVFLRYVYLYSLFEWAMFGLALLAALYLAVRPRERRALEMEMDDDIELDELRA